MSDAPTLADIATLADRAASGVRLTTAELGLLIDAAVRVGDAYDAAFHGLIGSLESLARVGGSAGQTFSSLAGTLTALSEGSVVGVALNLHRGAAALAEMSTEADRHDLALQRLGHTYDLVTQATNDTMDETDAFRMQQRLLEAGLQLTGQELANVAGFAREHARALGIDAQTATENLTSALITGSARGLRPYGIAVDHNATRADNLNAALDHMATNLATTGTSAQTASERIRIMDRELADATNDLGRSAASALHLGDVLHGLTDIIRDTGGVATTMGRSIQFAMALASGNIVAARAAYATIGAEERAATAQRAQAEADQASASTNLLRASEAAQARGVDLSHIQVRSAEDMVQLTNTLKTYQGESLAVQQQEVNAIGEARRLEALRARDAEGYALNERNALANQGTTPHTPHTPHHAGRGAHRADPEVERLRHVQEAHRALQHEDQLNATALAANRAADARAEDAMTTSSLAVAHHAETERVASIHRIEEAEKHRINAQHDLMQQEMANSDAMALANAQSHDVRLQMHNAWRETLHATQTAEQGFAQSSVEAWGMVTGAFKQHLAAYISGKETMQQALQGMLSDVLLNIATSSAIKALESQAAAVFAAASEDYPGAAKFEAAAIAYAGVALATGYGASVMMRAGASASDGGHQATPPRNASSAGGRDISGGGHMSLTFNNYGIYDSKGARGMVSDQIDDLSRNGASPVSIRSLQVRNTGRSGRL